MFFSFDGKPPADSAREAVPLSALEALGEGLTLLVLA